MGEEGKTVVQEILIHFCLWNKRHNGGKQSIQSKPQLGGTWEPKPLQNWVWLLQTLCPSLTSPFSNIFLLIILHTWANDRDLVQCFCKKMWPIHVRLCNTTPGHCCQSWQPSTTFFLFLFHFLPDKAISLHFIPTECWHSYEFVCLLVHYNLCGFPFPRARHQ